MAAEPVADSIRIEAMASLMWGAMLGQFNPLFPVSVAAVESYMPWLASLHATSANISLWRRAAQICVDRWNTCIVPQ